MPDLGQDDVIKSYWDKERHKYPELTFDEFAQVCRSLFMFVKEEIRSGKYPMIHLKGFGKFRIFPKTINDLLRDIENFRRVGTMSDELYEEKKSLFLKLQQMLEEQKPDEDDEDFEIIDDEENTEESNDDNNRES